jgi:prolyl 4-hydroxylase
MPVLFGGPLPWMVRKEGLVSAKVETKPIVPRAGAVVSSRSIKAAPAATTIPAKPAPAKPHRRAEIGAQVRERLLATKGVAKIPKDTLEAFVVPHFLTPQQCEGLMRLIDADRVPSGLLSPSADPEFRTSESCNLTPANPLVASFEWRVNELMGIEPALAETAQGQRYAVGQQFKAHHDFFYTDQPYWPEQEVMGGQRTWTAMAFLNKPEAGGQTMFPKAGLRITPAPGHLLIWNNLDAAGEPNPYSLHQGLPVEAGVKYVITKWYRERYWGRPDAAPAA